MIGTRSGHPIGRLWLTTCRQRAVATALSRYYAGGWRHERTRSQNPHPEGSLRAQLWAVLRAVDRPIGERQVRAILAGK